MRPILLKMSAFGPYAGEAVISMDELGNNGLFLITGDTGAGKTTIFDAICFALFGSPSGNNRENFMLRSKYADPNTDTKVELIFTHRGKEYRIVRNPEYMRPSKRGSGETKQAADASIELPDKSVITKPKEVNEKVIEILGVNREQFSQIAMIAQGDFMKLLFAKTDERQKIFRELFKTGYYQKLQFELDNKRKEIKYQVEDGKKSISQFIAGILVEQDEILLPDVNRAKAGELSTEDVLGLLKKLLEMDLKQKKQVDNEYASANKELELVNGNIQIAKILSENKLALGKSEENLKLKLPEEQAAKAALELAREALKNKEQLTSQAAVIANEMGKYDLLSQLLSSISNCETAIKNDEAALERKNKTAADSNTELESLKKEADELKDTGINLERINTDIEKTKNDLEAINMLEEDYRDLDSVKKSLNKAQDKYKEDELNYQQKKDYYEKKDQSFRLGQAGILAASLKEGEKCPVCGSTSHPQKAELLEELPSEEELKEAKELAEKARLIVADSSLQAGQIKSKLEIKESNVKEKEDRLLKGQPIAEVKDRLESRMAELKAELESENNNIKRKKELEIKIPELDKGIKEINGSIASLREQISARKSTLEANIRQCNDIKKELSFASSSDAKAKREKLLLEADRLQKDYDIKEKISKDKSREVIELKSKIEGYKKTIEETMKVDLETELSKKTELENRLSQALTKMKTIATRLSNNENILKMISEKSSDMAKLEEKLSWISALADTANGNLSQKEKITLEAYIQTTYFNRIIERANLRFLTMTSNQYELKRQEEPSKLKGKSGLELSVIDHYNGSERSVKTLSGGESFMAALSLALGLSDEVQSSGSAQIDTMFVDEGFGSLDGESLQQAYKALHTLTEGKRLVGIISHVSDLKEMIDTKIIVKKEKTGGSFIKIEN